MPPFPKAPPAPTLSMPTIAAETCGLCAYTKLNVQDVNLVECCGAPPTVAIAPGPNGQLGTVLLRPNMPRMEKACGLFKRKEAQELDA